jgi:hypothetical protein
VILREGAGIRVIGEVSIFEAPANRGECRILQVRCASVKDGDVDFS